MPRPLFPMPGTKEEDRGSLRLAVFFSFSVLRKNQTFAYSYRSAWIGLVVAVFRA